MHYRFLIAFVYDFFADQFRGYMLFHHDIDYQAREVFAFGDSFVLDPCIGVKNVKEVSFVVSGFEFADLVDEGVVEVVGLADVD